MKATRILVLSLFLAVHGLTSAGINEGVTAYKKGNYDTALREWRLLAEQGNARAQLNMGFMYHNGYGVPQDYKEAKKAARRADLLTRLATAGVLIPFVLWAIAQGGLLFSTIMHTTRAKWSGPLSNLAEAFTAFFPFSIVQCLVITMMAMSSGRCLSASTSSPTVISLRSRPVPSSERESSSL